MAVQLIQYDINTNNAHLVKAIPSDSVCLLSLGGAGLNYYDDAVRFAEIVSKQYLHDFVNIEHYSVSYCFEQNNYPFNQKPQRQIQFDKYNQNIDYDCDDFVYVSEKNIEHVFIRVIKPQIMRGNAMGLRYVVDGNVEKIKIILVQKILETAKKLGCPEPKKIVKNIQDRTVEYKKYFNPKYLDELFNCVLLPRIVDKDGKRLPLDVAQRQIRKINIFAHCHGAYIALMMDERLKTKMQQLGYSLYEIKQIQSQLLVVTINPACPLGVEKSCFINFTSLYNQSVNYPRNWITAFKNEKKDLCKNNISFLSDNYGNVFFCKNRFDMLENNIPTYREHHNITCHHIELNHTGKRLMALLYNVLNSGIKNSYNQTGAFIPLPEISELILDGVCDDKILQQFEIMKQNGNAFIKMVTQYACGYRNK